MKWQIWRVASGSAHTAHVIQQCLHRNCLQIIQMKQCPPTSPNLNFQQICL